ncbi:MAG: glycosyl hydrolase [Eubacteriales bacterium]|nr:glycosyl hydrolase [Eubacteriales bacterium]
MNKNRRLAALGLSVVLAVSPSSYAMAEPQQSEETSSYNAYATAGVGGRIADNMEGYTGVAAGESAAYRFEPEEGYRIKNVMVDGENIGAVEEYTFNDVTAAHTIKVTFTRSSEDADFQEKMDTLFSDTSVESEYWPETRWWLPEGLTTQETLKESIDELYDYGVGAVEFVTLDIDALSSDEELNARYAWGSDEWNADSQFIIEYCTEKGMGVSLTSGTNWGNANLPVEAYEGYIEDTGEKYTMYGADSEAAQQVVGYSTVELDQAGTYTLENPIDTDHKLRLVASMLVKVNDDNSISTNNIQNITEEIKQTTDLGDGALTGTGESVWTYDYEGPADSGKYQLYSVWQYGNWGTLSPSVSTNYVINYMSKEGMNLLKKYWDENIFTEELREVIKENGDVSFYMDSLEGVSGTGWCEDFLEEFQKSRGYDLLPYLTIIGTKTSNSAGGPPGAVVEPAYSALLDEEGNDITSKVNDDMRQVRTELYMNNCLQELTDWAHSFGMKLRAENSYGVSSFEISEPVKALDWVETESLEFVSDPDGYRLQAGAAHVYDKVYSSETGANNYANYRDNSLDYRNIFYTQFASTIARTVFHGYSSAYGPEGDVDWPGFEGMHSNISMRVNKRQPNSVDYSENLMPHLTRLQTALRQGVAQIDVAILRSDYNAYNDYFVATEPSAFGDGGNDYAVNDLRTGKSLYWQGLNLQQAGYTYDYWSPVILTDEDAHLTCKDGVLYGVNDSAAYQAVVIYQESFPYASTDKLEELAKQGLPIIFVDNSKEFSKDAGDFKEYKTAASKSLFMDASDAQVAEFMEDLITSYDNVVRVETEDDVLGILEGMNIYPRAAYGESNQKLLTTLRKDDDASYLYVYNYQYDGTEDYADNNGESYETTISIDGIYTPYEVNTWNGETKTLAEYSYQDGRTIISVNLTGGDVSLYALDPAEGEKLHATETGGIQEAVYDENGNVQLRVSETGNVSAAFSDGTELNTNVEAPEDIELNSWNLTVESWTKGERDVRTETKEGTDYTSTEVTYLTEKTNLDTVTISDLVPWSKIEGIGDGVSGVGYYTTSFELPENWTTADNAAYFSVDSFEGGTAQLLINGENAYIDMENGKADITPYVKAGENTVEVRVTTSLWNALITEGLTGAYVLEDAQPVNSDYGMTGTAKIITCTTVDATM